jgi:hypothetical protein
MEYQIIDRYYICKESMTSAGGVVIRVIEHGVTLTGQMIKARHIETDGQSGTIKLYRLCNFFLIL